MDIIFLAAMGSGATNTKNKVTLFYSKWKVNANKVPLDFHLKAPDWDKSIVLISLKSVKMANNNVISHALI